MTSLLMVSVNSVEHNCRVLFGFLGGQTRQRLCDTPQLWQPVNHWSMWPWIFSGSLHCMLSLRLCPPHPWYCLKRVPPEYRWAAQGLFITDYVDCVLGRWGSTARSHIFGMGYAFLCSPSRALTLSVVGSLTTSSDACVRARPAVEL